MKKKVLRSVISTNIKANYIMPISSLINVLTVFDLISYGLPEVNAVNGTA